MTDDESLLASDRKVDRIGKMLLQAEGERALGNEEAADNMMEQVLGLSQAYSIDLAVARARQLDRTKIETPERRSYKVGEYGLKGKNAHFADLMIAICDANDIEVTISHSAVNVFGTGMPSDLDMAERLFAILSVQMVQEADAGLKRGDNYEMRLEPKRVRVEISEEDRAWGQHDGSDSYGESCYYDERDEELEDGLRSRYNVNTSYLELVKSYPPPKFKNVETGEYEEKLVSVSDGRVWRVNFYQGFVNRTRSRLREAKRLALKDAGIDVGSRSDDRALALRDKTKEVREVFEENERFVLASGRTYGGAQVSRHDYNGQTAGDEAGQRAVLGNERVVE
jgi:hypothetical protein